MTKPTLNRKLIATALGALAVGIAAPATAQDAPVINPQTTPPPPVATQAQPAPAPVVAAPASAPAPAPALKLPEIEVAPAVVARADRPAPRRAIAPRTVAPAATPAAAPVERAAPAPAAIAPAPVVNAPVEADPPAASSVPEAAPAAATAAAPATETRPDWGTIGLIGGAGLLAAGAAAGLGRRRRIEPDDSDLAFEPAIVPERAATIDPAPIFPATAVTADAHGDHLALAEAGPTRDNPFLTRRARLKRARFLDRRAREMEAERAAHAPAAAEPVGNAARGEQVSYAFGKPRGGLNFGFGKPVTR